VEVVGHLDGVVTRLLVGAVVVAGRRVHREALDQRPVRLVEREVPVVVLVAGLGQRVLVAVVDVVAEADEEAHGMAGGQRLERAGHRLLAATGAPVRDADPVVPERQERDRHQRLGVGVGPEPQVVPPAGGDRSAGREVPVPPLSASQGRPSTVIR
jgi:hypothetical protein